ncbi:MAG: sugar kinase, partial [Myxococcota bacterium]
MIERSKNQSLLVVGSVAFDDIDGPFGSHRDLLGGSASFFATAASYFTNQVSMNGVVGDDFPRMHLDDGAARERGGSGVERGTG